MKHENIISQMTLEEKCSLLSGKDTWRTRAVERLGVHSMSLSDGPSGLRRQAGEGDHLGLNASTKATCIPSASTIANSWSPELARQMGAIVGTDAASQGVNVLLGPGLNTKRSPLCGRAFEYYSEDPYLAGKLAAGYIQGVQSKGVSACAKHFAVNSQELLRMHNDSVLDERTLRELYLTNFEIAVREGEPDAIMTSYNKVNGTYANENEHLYDILRNEWGFEGAVVTDWGGSNDIALGAKAGMNLEMPAAGDDSPCQLVQAVKDGKISEEIINRRVDELLNLMLAERPAAKADAAAQHELVEKAAEKCAVLLKNEGDILPIRQNAEVALIGDFAQTPRYQGAGSSMVNASSVDNTLDLITKYFPRSIGYAQGFERSGAINAELTQKAVELAKRAEYVLLYMGLPEGYETEGLDRQHMRLPQNQIELIYKIHEVNPHIVAVISAGSAVEMNWAEKCEAILYAGLGGQAVAGAILKILCGEVNPGGKLSETFPIKYEDMPSSRYYPGAEKTSEYRECIFVGYRYFTTAKKPVCFPFGYGLSYTEFAYSNISVDDRSASFDITNTGTCAGDEIAQMYISLKNSKIFRPAGELKGFERVALEAGETKRVRMEFDEFSFRYFNTETNKWEIEGGEYTIQIGASCEDIRLSTCINIAGTTELNPYASAAFKPYFDANVCDISDETFKALLGRDIPQSKWDRSAPLEINDTMRQLFYAKNPIARLAYKVLTNAVNKAIERGKPDLNLLFIYNIPFRGMAKMMNGMVSADMANDILLMCNGHWHRGLIRLIHHFFHRPKLKIQ